MLYISFELTMPNKGSWDGKWTGEGRGYFITRSFHDKEDATKKIKELLNGQPSRNFYYNFGDGWGANVAMRISSATSNRTIQKKSAGFCGYDWMVSSIIQHGKIQS